jgi:septum formation protein
MNVSAPKISMLILASSSPRRRELMTEAGYTFTVIPPTDDAESAPPGDLGPAQLVRELALLKASNVTGQLAKQPISGHRVIVAADTVAECNGEILGKPTNQAHARAMLQQLRGTHHRVFSGVCVWPVDQTGQPQAPPDLHVESTSLQMDQLTDQQLQEYLDSNGWVGKAGAFGYQDQLGWVHIVEGSESNVVGLPMERLGKMLAAVGIYPRTL